ncbi:hypothetical protein HMSSN036_13340 [Paenibacillus macerans]|nr:hypothetical protein HMSSN036_13340 [Paenibacillus macerans]
MLRTHGSKRKYYNERIGFNSRLDELQAAILRVKLPHVDARNEQRRLAADRYGELLHGLDGLILPEECAGGVKHVYHQYTIRVLNGKRDELKAALAAAGISTIVYYPLPVHKLPVYAADSGGRRCRWPNSCRRRCCRCRSGRTSERMRSVTSPGILSVL